MKTLTAVPLVVIALSTGCAAATGPQSLPEEPRFNRVSTAYVDVLATPSAGTLLRELPRALAKHGYFIIRTEPGVAEGYRFLTDWRVRPIYPDEVFEGVQQARTRLVVDARNRGNGYAVSIFAVSYLEDASGAWRQAAVSNEMRKQLRDIGTQFELDVR
jgi:hypothetical protein